MGRGHCLLTYVLQTGEHDSHNVCSLALPITLARTAREHSQLNPVFCSGTSLTSCLPQARHRDWRHNFEKHFLSVEMENDNRENEWKEIAWFLLLLNIEDIYPQNVKVGCFYNLF